MGFMYESLDQCDPIFDAKGIETVRRDTCPAVAKVLASIFYGWYMYCVFVIVHVNNGYCMFMQ